MKPNTSPALTYFPAYLGLYLSLTLAAICNDYVLQMKVRGFGILSVFWGVLFAFCLWLGWRQRGAVSSSGELGKRVVIVISLLLMLFVIRTWDFPRVGVIMLLLLQAAQCCVCVSRRQLYMGLLVSLVIVLFASAHSGADWTMLFYLLPYIVAVVFTLVAEQVSRRSEEVQRDSLGRGVIRGQGVAIVFATLIILASGALLYSVTPQVTWPNLFWNYGQPGNVGGTSKIPGLGQGNQSGQPASGQGAGLSIEDMRAAARRPGMPGWQSASIEALADGAELLDGVLQPLYSSCTDWWAAFKEWLKQHKQVVLLALMALLAVLLLVASWKLIRELRLVVWLRVQLDYLQLVGFRQIAPGNSGAYSYYRALQRLMDLHELDCSSGADTRQYLRQVSLQFQHLSQDAQELTLIFEKARYGNQEISDAELACMGQAYRRMYQRIDILNALDA